VRVELAGRARRDLDALDAPVRERIQAALASLPDGDVRRLAGADQRTWRLRVSDSRILCVRPEPDLILVVRVTHRSRAH
jgi:mRNA-degrading endonuclease RelE of RelBE toxin-antitoxin system